MGTPWRAAFSTPPIPTGSCDKWDARQETPQEIQLCHYSSAQKCQKMLLSAGGHSELWIKMYTIDVFCCGTGHKELLANAAEKTIDCNILETLINYFLTPDDFDQKNGVFSFSVGAAEAQLGQVFVAFPPWQCNAQTCVPLMENRNVLYQLAISVTWRGFSVLKGR